MFSSYIAYGGMLFVKRQAKNVRVDYETPAIGDNLTPTLREPTIPSMGLLA